MEQLATKFAVRNLTEKQKMAEAPKPPAKDTTPDNLKTKEIVGVYTIHRFVSSDQIIADTSINGVLLHDAVVEQAALAAFYGELHAKATRQSSMLKLNLNAVEARIDAEIRGKAGDEGKKITEKAIEAAVNDDNRVKAARKALIVADEVRNTLFAACDAIRQRRDSLEILGRFQNEEMKGTLRIQQQDATRQKATDVRQRLADMTKAA